ncbi:hypothetical protein [Sulfoacidibacillus thermotolerans]|nr:hypothetical protein [Sulfoacidibacillus thermotolerans]
MDINLWNPSGHLSVLAILITALLLGMVHGITPDEHTWPITFSYSVGSYSSRGGRKMGFLFSLAFTFQRALASELAFLALSQFEFANRWGYEVYFVVGIVMWLSGLYILNRGTAWHLFDFGHRHAHAQTAEPAQEPRPLPRYMPLVHGFIAGWGVGAFAVIIYTVLAPQMPTVWVGWVPGALFGLGTMLMQVVLGGLFGAWMSRRHLPESVRVYVARKMSGRTLAGGGIGFIIVALLGILFPTVISNLAVVTPLHIHNLHNLGVGFFLAVILLFSVATWAFWKSVREGAHLSERQIAKSHA